MKIIHTNGNIPQMHYLDFLTGAVETLGGSRKSEK